jgi:hypothetical protein
MKKIVRDSNDSAEYENASGRSLIDIGFSCAVRARMAKSTLFLTKRSHQGSALAQTVCARPYLTVVAAATVRPRGP